MPARRQQAGQLRQQIAGLAQMFQDVGANDEVITTSDKTLGQHDLFEIGTLQATIPRRSLGGGGGIVLNSVHDAFEVFGQIATQNARTRSQIQH